MQRIKRYIPPNARSGIALPIIRIDDVDYDLEDLAVDDLLQLRVHLEEQMSVIELQIANAASQFQATGEASDPQWFNHAKFARKMKGKQVQAIQGELSKRKHNRQESIEKRFVNAARIMLNDEVFAAIMNAARQI